MYARLHLYFYIRVKLTLSLTPSPKYNFLPRFILISRKARVRQKILTFIDHFLVFSTHTRSSFILPIQRVENRDNVETFFHVRSKHSKEQLCCVHL